MRKHLFRWLVCSPAPDESAAFAMQAGLYEVGYMFDCRRPDDPMWYLDSLYTEKVSYPTAPWVHAISTAPRSRDAQGPLQRHICHAEPTMAWSPPDGRGEVRSDCWAGTSNRLTCGCVLYARIRIEQGVDRVRPGTHGRIFHLEAGDRIEMHFWLHISKTKKSNGTQDTCKLGGGGLTEHVVRLDEGRKDENDKGSCVQKPCVQKQLFDTAPWLKFTLVADKPESNHDVGHVPLRTDQLPGLLYLSREGGASATELSFL